MLTDIIGALRRDPEFAERVTHWEVIPARPGRYVDIPAGVDPRITTALEARGIKRIYSHQAAAWEKVRAGQSVVIVSPDPITERDLPYESPTLTSSCGREIREHF